MMGETHPSPLYLKWYESPRNPLDPRVILNIEFDIKMAYTCAGTFPVYSYLNISTYTHSNSPLKHQPLYQLPFKLKTFFQFLEMSGEGSYGRFYNFTD